MNLLPLLLACSSAPDPATPVALSPPPAEARMSLVWIVIDTLRADHLGAYGHERPTSPAIDALAAEGVRYTRAYATAPWTMPSIASMLTGRYPSAHGVTAIPQVLDPELELLPERLQAAGYRTAASVSHLLLRKKYGFGQGFERFTASGVSGSVHANVSTEAVTTAALGHLDAISGGDAPFFLFVHYFDPHYNYTPHPEYGFAAAEGAGRLSGDEDISQLRRMSLREGEVAYLRDLYDEEIRFTDDGVGALMSALEARGLADETAVFLTADHGEELLERGWLGHTRTLNEELVRVPLIVRAPGLTPATIDAPVSLTAMPATALSLLGLDAPVDLPPPLPTAPGDPTPEAPFFEVDFVAATPAGVEKEAHMKGAVFGDLKLVFDAATGETVALDLAADPDERSPHPATEAQRARLQAAAEAAAAAASAPAAGEAMGLSEEEEEALRGLGYVE